MASVYWIHLPDHTDIFSQGYVGITSLKLRRRFERHLHNAKNKRDICPKLERAICKYGADSIIFEEMVRGETSYCAEVEEHLRPAKNIGWNLWSGGNKGILGFKQSEETKAKVNIKKIGRPVSLETRAKISASLQGNKCALGSIRTPEMRRAHAVRHKGYRHGLDALAKISAASKGRIVSPETKLKMREAALRRINRAA